MSLESYDSSIVSVDFLYIHMNDQQFDPADQAETEAALRKEELWQPSAVAGYVNHAVEFPL